MIWMILLFIDLIDHRLLFEEVWSLINTVIDSGSPNLGERVRLHISSAAAPET